MNSTGVGADTVIILARDQASLYEFLKPRQEAGGGTVVILDRRAGERRRDGDGTRPAAGDNGPQPDRRKRDRRRETPEAALALMSVLGFMILHRDEDRWVP